MKARKGNVWFVWLSLSWPGGRGREGEAAALGGRGSAGGGGGDSLSLHGQRRPGLLQKSQAAAGHLSDGGVPSVGCVHTFN